MNLKMTCFRKIHNARVRHKSWIHTLGLLWIFSVLNRKLMVNKAASSSLTIRNTGSSFGRSNCTNNFVCLRVNHFHNSNNNSSSEESEDMEASDLGTLYEYEANATEATIVEVQTTKKYEDDNNIFNTSTISINDLGWFSTCKDLRVLRNDEDLWFQVQNATLQIGLRWPFHPLWISLSPETYCLTGEESEAEDTDAVTAEYFNYSNFSKNVSLVICPSVLEDYQTYVSRCIRKIWSRIALGICNLICASLYVCVLVMYVLMWKSHKLVGWLISTIALSSVSYYFVSGTLTIVYAKWLDVETTSMCTFWHGMARYLQMVLISANFMVYIHMLETFWKLNKRVKEVSKSFKRLKIYLPFIWVLPLIIVTIDQSVARHSDEKSEWIQQTSGYAHGRCSPPETLVFEHILTGLVVSTLLVVLSSGVIIARLRCSSKFQAPSLKSQVLQSSTLFWKLLSGSGSPILIRILIFLYLDIKNPLSWLFTGTLILTELYAALYYFFVFGLTKENIKKMAESFNEITMSMTESINSVTSNRKDSQKVIARRRVDSHATISAPHPIILETPDALLPSNSLSVTTSGL